MSEKWKELYYQVYPRLQGLNLDEHKLLEFLQPFAEYYGVHEGTEDFKKAYRKLCEDLHADIDLGHAIQDPSERHHDWLKEMLARKQARPRTFAYKCYLSNNCGVKDPRELGGLESAAKRVLGFLADPRRDSASEIRKGLILGDVQSGKTRTYLALMNMAADFGYKLFIVLTSDNEKLREQTQIRIDSDFIGYRGGKIGIGRYLPRDLRYQPLTAPDCDFGKATQRTLTGFHRPDWEGDPVVAVVKKNARILGKLNKWLKVHDRVPDIPTLIIDDESDYASINSAKSEDSPSRINGQLRDLCSISSRTSYVAVTATPFANVFIDDQVSADLFPKDFIYVKHTPSGYTGAKELFGTLDTPSSDRHCVHEIDYDDMNGWLPIAHKKTYLLPSDPSELNGQIKHAIACFFVACALRPESAEIRQSMLIHMSRYQSVQLQLAKLVSGYVNTILNALLFHADDRSDPRIAALYHAFHEEYCEPGDADISQWDDVLDKMSNSVSRVTVRLANASSAARDWLQMNSLDEKPADDECTIYIGGDRLSRGLTLDGLICSIFYRRVTASDTLLQMARWFGYRDGYANLQRIWLLKESIHDFQYAAGILEDVKKDAITMEKQGRSPSDFGMRIKKDPSNGIQVTNPSKMRNAAASTVWATFDLTGKNIESTRLSADSAVLDNNDIALNKLLASLESDSSASCQNIERKSSVGRIYRNVPIQMASDFLQQYRGGHADTYFGPAVLRRKGYEDVELADSVMSRYAATQSEIDPDSTWIVVFMNGSADAGSNDALSWWYPSNRRVSYEHPGDADGCGTFMVSGMHARLALRHDVKELAGILAGTGNIGDVGSERAYYLKRYFGEYPTLMLYRIKPTPEQHDDAKHIKESGNRLLLGAKLIIPADEVSEKDRYKRGDVYFYNTVAYRQILNEQSQLDFDDDWESENA